MTAIRLGRQHPTIRRLRRLRDDGARRRQEQVFVAEGLHLAVEALEATASVELALVAENLERTPEGREVRRRILDAGIPCHEVAQALMDSLQEARSPQPILLLVRRTPRSLDACLDHGPAPALVVVCHGLQDPGNLGALLRTADAAGASALLTCGPSVDLFHPRTVRASMGSIFRLPAGEFELHLVLEALRERGLTRVASVVGAGPSPTAVDLTRGVALFLGGEGQGLPEALLGQIDRRVSIPMRAGVNSLSVGAAAAILLYEARRQRQEL